MKILDRLISRLVYIFIFLLPWQTRYFLQIGEINGGYFEYATYSLYVVDLFLLLIAVLSLWRAIALRQKIRLRLIWLLAAFLELLILLSAILGIDFNLSFSRYLWFLAALFIAYLLSTSTVINRRVAWRVFLLSAILPAILGIGQFVNNFSLGNKYLGLAEKQPEIAGVSVVEYESDGIVWRQLRAYGPFGHPNMFGGFLAIVLVSAVIYFRRRESCSWYQTHPRKFLVYSTVYLALLSLALVLSFSRAAVLAAVLAIVVYWFLAPPYATWQLSRERYRVLGVLILFLLLLNFSLWPLWSARLSGDNRLAIISQTERIAGYSQAQQLIKGNCLLGVGLGNYSQELTKAYPQEPAYYYQPVHNTWLLLLVEVGILGWLTVAALVSWVFLRGLKYRRAEVVAMASGLLVLTMLDHWFLSLHFGYLFLGLIFSGMITGSISSKKK